MKKNQHYNCQDEAYNDYYGKEPCRSWKKKTKFIDSVFTPSWRPTHQDCIYSRGGNAWNRSLVISLTGFFIVHVKNFKRSFSFYRKRTSLTTLSYTITSLNRLFAVIRAHLGRLQCNTVTCLLVVTLNCLKHLGVTEPAGLNPPLSISIKMRNTLQITDHHWSYHEYSCVFVEYGMTAWYCSLSSTEASLVRLQLSSEMILNHLCLISSCRWWVLHPWCSLHRSNRKSFLLYMSL